jgi:serine/threonine-protein kinase RsbW
LNTMHQITRAAILESLSAFREFIDGRCQNHPGIDSQILYDLKLAVDEACTNIITHGYAGMNPGSIILTCEVEESQVTLTITDFGHPFEPSEAPQPDIEAALEERPMGGFGLYFIYQTMDEVGYKTTEDGNCLSLGKKLPQ